MKKSYGFSYEGVRYRAVRWEGANEAPLASAGARPSAISPASGTFLASDGLSAAGIPHPLVLLHGFAQSADVWDEVASRLACKRPVHALDFVGQGESERPKDPAPYALKAVSDALLAFLRHVQQESGGLAPVVVGYSMGGRLALAAACQACAGEPPASSLPFSMLVLESAGLGPRVARRARGNGAPQRGKRAAPARRRPCGLHGSLGAAAPVRHAAGASGGCAPAGNATSVWPTTPKRWRARSRALAPTPCPTKRRRWPTIRALVAYGVPVRYVAGALDDKYGATADLVASQTQAVCPSGARGGPQRPPGGRRRLRAPAGGHRLCAAVTATDVAHRAFFWRCDALPARGCASHRQVWRYRCATGPRGCRRRAPAGRILPGGGSRGTRGCPARGLPTCPRRHRGD